MCRAHSYSIFTFLNKFQITIQHSFKHCPMITMRNFNVDILKDINHEKKKQELLDFMDKLKLKSLFNKNITKVGFQLDHIWANVLKNEYVNMVNKSILTRFLQLIYIVFKLPNTLPMYNKKPLSYLFFNSVAYKCYIFHLINDTRNDGTLWPKLIYFY